MSSGISQLKLLTYIIPFPSQLIRGSGGGRRLDRFLGYLLFGEAVMPSKPPPLSVHHWSKMFLVSSCLVYMLNFPYSELKPVDIGNFWDFISRILDAEISVSK